MSTPSWLGLRAREEGCPGLESEFSWGGSWLDIEEPEGRIGALLNRAGEKSLQETGQVRKEPQRLKALLLILVITHGCRSTLSVPLPKRLKNHRINFNKTLRKFSVDVIFGLNPIQDG